MRADSESAQKIHQKKFTCISDQKLGQNLFTRVISLQAFFKGILVRQAFV